MSEVAQYDRQVLESALEWWRDAGVDLLVEDTPRDWFAKPAASPPAPTAEPESTDLPPGEWDAFLAWRGGEHAPEARWIGPAVLASGPAPAAVMVLSDVPDREDCAAGKLLSGEAGRLFDRMLAAIGLSRESVHLASVCAKRPTGGRVGRDDQARLGELARHHAGLVAPKRLLLMGDTASRAVLGMSVLEARGRLHPIDHKGGRSEAVASFHPRFLLENPGRKREAWADLQLLIRGTGK
ncbi:uracil-DNA glycosylase [Sphingomonas lenta]|uniref:uracil-DNA glycosylase n=1 Tax=Sphingomonas lenta TaxID=1141887 RepID=UPI001FE872AB|nr:uracil-DNA glycosylase [Sphingomonas lenta]